MASTDIVEFILDQSNRKNLKLGSQQEIFRQVEKSLSCGKSEIAASLSELLRFRYNQRIQTISSFFSTLNSGVVQKEWLSFVAADSNSCYQYKTILYPSKQLPAKGFSAGKNFLNCSLLPFLKAQIEQNLNRHSDGCIKSGSSVLSSKSINTIDSIDLSELTNEFDYFVFDDGYDLVSKQTGTLLVSSIKFDPPDFSISSVDIHARCSISLLPEY